MSHHRMVLACLATVSTMLGTACGTSQPAPATNLPTVPHATIALGQAPVFDGSPMAAAEHLGYFGKVGLTVNIRTFGDVQGIGQAAAAGSLNAGLFGDQGGMPAIANLGHLTYCTFGDIFAGYAIMGRNGKQLTFKDALAKTGGDRQKALQLTMQGLKGKTIMTQLSAGTGPFLRLLLADANMSLADLHVTELNSPDSATAFIRGDGDLQLGDVPSQYRLSEQGAVQVITAKDVGPTASLYVGYVCNTAWLASNHDTMLRLLSVWYHVADDLNNKNADRTLTIMFNWVNRNAGTTFDLKQAQYIAKTVSPWPTFDEAGNIFYDPTQSTYIGQRLGYVINGQVASHKIPTGSVTPESVTQAAQLYQELKNQKAAADKNFSELKGRNLSGSAKSAYSQAQSYYAIRDYLDAARFSDAALHAS